MQTERVEEVDVTLDANTFLWKIKRASFALACPC
jgi:hypothetical protein